MIAFSPVEFAALIGDRSIQIIVTRTGVVIHEVGEGQRTILQMPSLPADERAATRALAAAFIGYHTGERSTASTKERARVASAHLARLEARGLAAERATALKADFLLDGVDIDAVRAEEAARLAAEDAARIAAENQQ